MVTIQVKENSKQAKKMVEYLKTLPFVEFVEGKNPLSKKEKIAEDGRSIKKTKPRLSTEEVEQLFDKSKLTEKEKAFYRKFRKSIAELRVLEAGKLEGIPLEKTLNEI